jgi:hypothetical protein
MHVHLATVITIILARWAPHEIVRMMQTVVSQVLYMQTSMKCALTEALNSHVTTILTVTLLSYVIKMAEVSIIIPITADTLPIVLLHNKHTIYRMSDKK